MHPEHDLVVAANRDEFYDRPTASMAPWADAPAVLAGRDLEAGGTWMGATRSGRFAAITNFRDPTRVLPEAPSRGHLVSDFLLGAEAPAEYLARIAREGHRFNGYNLLAGDRQSLWYYSNRGVNPRPLTAGVYGLSNHLLDTSWPKVDKGKQQLGEAMVFGGESLRERLLELLSDRVEAPDENLPHTGVGMALERSLSPLFIVGERYGTRASTVLLRAPDGSALMTEATFERARRVRTRHFQFDP